jgi:hypothetical protein
MAKQEIMMSEFDKHLEGFPAETVEAVKSILHKQRVGFRHLQDTMPAMMADENFVITVEYQGDGRVLIRWKNRWTPHGEYTMRVSRINGLVDVDAFQGARLLTEMSGDGTFVDNGLEEGEVYLYHLVARKNKLDLKDVEEYAIPYMVPISARGRNALRTLLQMHEHDAVEEASEEFTDFAELEESIDELEQGALAKLAEKYTGNELSRRKARFQSFCSKLRERYGKQ